MGVSDSPDIFQEKMNKIFRRFEFIRVYINDLLVIIKVDWSNQLEKLELTLKNLQDNRIKCNTKISFFGKTDMEYLGFWVTRTGI